MDDGGVRWRLYAEAFRAWVPIVVSLCAISLTIYQAQATRRHNRLAVMPRVDVRFQVDGDTGDIEMRMVDVGIGPAVVTGVALVEGGVRFDRGDFAACRILDERLGREGDDWDTECFVMDGTYVLRPGDGALLYASRRADGLPPVAPKIPEDLDVVEVAVRYCSFYEDCWLSTER
ncbi:hypothetical protein [Amaricoccus sp.]|uniref:hypothetical protein n=1 Tax=Amaricoccus sp. TaxID=1872485 RepID=UPI001B661C4A|nr:hypothetical protein [Amaricoccus sp.]MBP7002495.1 hypothetical protein [Amaricoccus sp.]